jgi:hypothetical protein
MDNAQKRSQSCPALLVYVLQARQHARMLHREIVYVHRRFRDMDMYNGWPSHVISINKVLLHLEAVKSWSG